MGALLVFALLLWCTAATPGKIDDPSTYTCAVYSSALSLLPPVVAIVLALNTKEVYTSLLVGIATGALLYANGNLELALTTLFFNEDSGMVSKLSDSSNVGILVFLVMLGILVALMNKAGGSAAFGRWASTHIHTRAGAQFATLLLGILIFVDDYFNCLTVGSVMRPVTDRQKVSRAKLAYLIDATAAPVCIIAPVSSWAAAVTSSVPDGSGINGFTMFLRTIPYNYYAILTMVMSLFLIFSGLDYGPMKSTRITPCWATSSPPTTAPTATTWTTAATPAAMWWTSSRRCWCSSRPASSAWCTPAASLRVWTSSLPSQIAAPLWAS